MSGVCVRHNGIFRTANMLFLDRENGDERPYQEWERSMKDFTTLPPEDHASYEALDLAGAAIEKWTNKKSKETCATTLQEIKDRITLDDSAKVPAFIAL